MHTLPPDTHTHTALCKHARGGIADYVRAAQQNGLAGITFADHCPAPDGYDPQHRMVIEQFDGYRRGVLDAREQAAPFPVGFGIEADYYEGGTDFLRNWLPRRQFDLVIGSVHYIGDWGFDNPANRTQWKTVDITAAWRRYFELVGRLADTGLYQVVGHLDLPKKFGFRPADPDLREMAAPALDRIAAAGMAVELNTSGLHKEAREMYPSPLLLAMLRERDIPICFGSDAHAPEEVGRAFGEAIRAAREAGYTRYASFPPCSPPGTLLPLPA
ncbi:MAG: histidinol-phosphatase HisJ family protein [Lentisphaerae bacterium]|nr:histidinol-phosphatase HisJ family protein [Lentisphaerota bacterium]